VGRSTSIRFHQIARLHYSDGSVEDHPPENGVQFTDYIRMVDVPGSRLAFMLRDQQPCYLAIRPKNKNAIERVELVNGQDESAPIVMPVTVETGAGD
jgi:hypothetical protein